MGMISATPAPPERLLAYHPIVVGDQVIVDNEKQITAYNLNTRPGDQLPSAAGPVEVAWKTPDLMGADDGGPRVFGPAPVHPDRLRRQDLRPDGPGSPPRCPAGWAWG